MHIHRHLLNFDMLSLHFFTCEIYAEGWMATTFFLRHNRRKGGSCPFHSPSSKRLRRHLAAFFLQGFWCWVHVLHFSTKTNLTDCSICKKVPGPHFWVLWLVMSVSSCETPRKNWCLSMTLLPFFKHVRQSSIWEEFKTQSRDMGIARWFSWVKYFNRHHNMMKPPKKAV